MPDAPLVTPVFMGCHVRCSRGKLGDGEWCELANKCPRGHSVGRKWFRKYRGVYNAIVN